MKQRGKEGSGKSRSVRQSRTLNQELKNLPEIVQQNAVSQYGPPSSGVRHHRQHVSWLARRPEVSSGGDSGRQGQGQGRPDAGKQNQPANADRRNQYQRTGYYDKQNDSVEHSSGVGEAAQNVSKPMRKYRVRGHNHPRRGSRVCSQTGDSGAHGNRA